VDPWGSHGGRATVDRADRKQARIDYPSSVGDAHAAAALGFLFSALDMHL
jgi:hypothetical protein